MTKPPSPRPLSVSIIAIIYLVIVPISVAMDVWGPRLGISILAVFYGVLGTLPSFWLLPSIFACLVFLPLGIGLWQLREMARRIAIGWELVTIVQYVAFTIYTLVVYERMFNRDGFIVGICALLVSPHSVILWFLIKRKAAFIKAPTASQG